MERLDKRLANTGKWSRKEARELIRAGRVRLDGAVCRVPEQKVDADAPVTVDGEPVAADRPVYLMLNKPAGVVSSTDEPGERTVLDLLDEEYRHIGLFPADGWIKTPRACCCSPTTGRWPTGCWPLKAMWTRYTTWRPTVFWMKPTWMRCARE